jgi:proteic killer suppression protein
VLKSFACKETEAIWQGKTSRALPPEIQARARRRLRVLDNAQELEDLRTPPSHHLEALHGDREGQWSIRINRQWRICFRWDDGAHEVEIVDYH